MKKILIIKDVRILGVAYPVTGKAVEVEDAVAAELLKFGLAKQPVEVEQKGAEPGVSGSAAGDDAGQSQSTDDQIKQNSLFAAPENKAIGAAEENKKEE